MNDSPNQQSVLVLGGGSDIGLAIARRFAADGFDVQLAARNPDALAAEQSDIALRHGVGVSLHRFDVRDLDAAEAFLDALPRLPAVVVSVVGWLGEQEETAADPALARTAVETNLLGPAWMLEVAARRLAAQDGARAIIGISSVAGDRGRATNYWYGAAKAGFTAVLSGLRQKYTGTALNVLTVKPGFVATRMTEGMDLPGALTSSPEQIAEGVHRAWKRGRGVVYLSGRWRLVMGVIRALPESIFRKTSF